MLDEALRRYRQGAFTDDDVTRCSGLSVRAWRELIKIGAVRTITELCGPGRVRLCDATTLKRAAVIAALNRAGLSLAMAGRIAYFMPRGELLYHVWDPSWMLLQGGADVNPETGLPPYLKEPKFDWFDPDKPASADQKLDWLIEIYERRFVGLAFSTEYPPLIYGDLRNEGTSFVSWYVFHQLYHLSGPAEKIAEALAPYKIGDFIPKWANPYSWSDRLDPGFLDYRYENHDADDDPVRIAAEASVRSSVFKIAVNVTLAIRKALRRYLGIEPGAPGPGMMGST
jgi:hypothetical protein